MNIDQFIQRARLLLDHEQHARAEEELNQALAAAPDHAEAHALMALCLSKNKDRWRDATTFAERAVHLAPDQPFGFVALARLLDLRNHLPEALAAVDQALALNPYLTPAHALRAGILLQLKRYQECLEAAETGLSIEPDDDSCGSLRTMALERLGRTTDALGEAQRSLAHNPDSSSSHSSMGWALLNSGQYRAAQESFREALRLDPTNEFARAGMINALKNDRFIFRQVYKFYTWMGRMSGNMQWVIILSIFFGQKILGQLAANNPALAPWITPIIHTIIAFCLLTWIANPLFETFLRFHPMGRFLLSRKEKWASNVIGGIIAGSILWGIIFGYLAHDATVGYLFFIAGLVLTIPASLCFRVDEGWPLLVSIAAACILLLMFMTAFVAGPLGLVPLALVLKLISFYFIAILVYSFAGNALLMANVRQ